MPDPMTQYAPWPDDLEAAVRDFRYLDGWTFSLDTIDRDFADVARTQPIAGGLTFVIFVPCFDSYHPSSYRPVVHYHPVPAATFNRASWERWIIERLLDTLRHEACEHARFEEVTRHRVHGREWEPETIVRRPFAPLHGPGDDPYVLHDLVSVERAQVSFRGEKNEGDPLASTT